MPVEGAAAGGAGLRCQGEGVTSLWEAFVASREWLAYIQTEASSTASLFVKVKPIRLNIGCGDDIRPGYLNIDPFADGPVLRMEASRLAFPDRSVDEVYCSHVLEHMSKHEVMDVLVEWNRVLKPGGRVEIIVPDLPWCMKQWLRLPDSARWDWALDTIFGLQDHPGEFHKTGFSTDRLHYLLAEAGFRSVDVSTCFDHGMQSIRALASAGDPVPGARGTDAISWVRKQVVFLFFRICAGLPRFRLKKQITPDKESE